MNSAEGFSVNNVAQQERAHPQADSSEIPAMVDWILLISRGPEKVGDEGPFLQPFSVGSEGDRPGPHEGATHPASQASRCFLQDPRFSQLFHRQILSDVFVGIEQGNQRLEMRRPMTPTQLRPRDPLLLEKIAQMVRKASP